ncbi:DUF3854 domain-containing protein [Thalassoglobus sp. JC818]|uniref:DUF3854 domain-containing protein n=1 Tax=Thalassoglobus sp. JC818 TaxID=3232136 RepID=UPI0034597D0C
MICRRSAMHPSLGAGKQQFDKSGGKYYLWRTQPQETSNRLPKPKLKLAQRVGPTKDRSRVYKVLLRLFGPTTDHRMAIGSRGIPLSELNSFLDHVKYGSLPKSGRAKRLTEMIRVSLEEEMAATPGCVIRKSTSTGQNYWTLAGPSGMLIPIRNSEGEIAAMQVRCDDDQGNGKYRYLTSRKDGGVKSGALTHFPLRREANRHDVVRVTEGALKADIATYFSDIYAIGLPGVGCWKQVLNALDKLDAQQLTIAFDADFRTNSNVAMQLFQFVDSLKSRGVNLAIETWNSELAKGIDDLVVSGNQSTLLSTLPEIDGFLATLKELHPPLSLIDPQAPSPSASTALLMDPAARTLIEVNKDEFSVNEQVVSTLPQANGLYSRSGQLSEILHDDHGGSRIVAISRPRLRELMCRMIYFFASSPDGAVTQISPPKWCVDAVFDRGEWPGVPILKGIVSRPILRRDGGIVNQHGYDADSRLYLDKCFGQLQVLENPTQVDALAARDRLLNLVADFPIREPHDRSAWLAALLTIVGRDTFEGPAPLFLVDANTHGSGKTLLADLLGLISIGKSACVSTAPSDDNEFRKRITAHLMHGDEIVLLDNIGGTLGTPSLDALLTSDTWRDRILGKSQISEIPNRTTWLATGNNVTLQADTSRRVCPIRLESLEEHPEDRKDFQVNNLRQHVIENQQHLLTDALTIIQAWFRAGQPTEELKPWGSFEGWTATIRQLVVWTKLPDPILGRDHLRDEADSDAVALKNLFTNWLQIEPERLVYSARELIDCADSDSHTGMANALCELCCVDNLRSATATLISKRLKRFKGRVIDGCRLISYVDPRMNVTVWKLEILGS